MINKRINKNIRYILLLKIVMVEPGQIDAMNIVEDTMELNFEFPVLFSKDKNGKMTTNLVGYPIEPYGFSNNKFGKFGPPDFSDVSFTLKSGQSLFLKINLK